MNFGRQSAFTLVEIMVVLGIIGLVLAVIPPIYSRVIPSGEINSAVRYLASGLKMARSRAIATGQDSTLTLNVKKLTYRVGEKEKELKLPSKANISLITARSEQTANKSGAIRFFPDGSSTGGQIKLDYRNSGFLIDVDWLTGKVTISP